MDRAGTWAERHGIEGTMRRFPPCLFSRRAEGLGGKGLETGKETVTGMDLSLLRVSLIRSFLRQAY